jgi:MFS transporter, DHA1 family, tetracycline resistance protein
MQKRQAAIIFILITLFIDILGIGIIIPVLPELIKEISGGDVAGAGKYYGWITASYALMQFFFAPILGALSDRFGRRPVILLSLLGLGLDYIILGFANSIAWLFIGRIVAGVMGASITAANAYIADISTPENRAQNFGFVGLAFGLGFIFGPVLGGILGGINLRLPFFVSAALVLLNVLYGFFILPESLKKENRSKFSWSKVNPVSSIQNLTRYPLVANLAFAFLFITLAQGGLQTVWVLYTGYRYGWGEMTNGLTLGLVGLMAAIVQGGLVRPVIKALGERKTILLGLSISVLSFLFYGLAAEGWMMLVVIVLGALAGVAQPAIQGLVAGSVSPSEQGKVQGALTSLFSLTSIFAPLIFVSGLFSYFTAPTAPLNLPGAPFFLGSLFNLIALVVVFMVFRKFQPQPQPPTT